MSKPTNTVLLIDDESRIRRFVRAGFELHGGFSVREAETATDGLKMATFKLPDLIILDLELPDMYGADVLQQLRSWSNVPVIILSVGSNEEEKVRLLRMGADDYIVKPFGIAELMARSEAALRRYFKGANENPIVTAGVLSIDLAGRIVRLNDGLLRLTRKEYSLLHILAKHAGLVVTHGQLLREIWSDSQKNQIQYLRILVRKLRQKIETDPDKPQLIISESGVGYRLSSPTAAKTPMPAGTKDRA